MIFRDTDTTILAATVIEIVDGVLHVLAVLELDNSESLVTVGTIDVGERGLKVLSAQKVLEILPRHVTVDASDTDSVVSTRRSRSITAITTITALSTLSAGRVGSTGEFDANVTELSMEAAKGGGLSFLGCVELEEGKVGEEGGLDTELSKLSHLILNVPLAVTRVELANVNPAVC